MAREDSHFMRIALPILVLIVFSSIGSAQTAEKKPAPAPERAREIISLLGEARLAAPEIGVDTFIKVAQSKKVTDAAWRLEILEEALRMSGDVKYPVRRVVIPFNGIPVDTVAGYLSYAHDQKLDDLSLKSRIIRELLKVNKERARQVVFELGGRLGLKPLKCEDALAYEVSDIYRVVGAVAKEVFTPKEVADGVRAQFVAAWFENITSPAQIAPALDLLEQFKGSEAEKFLLFAAMSQTIDRNFGDDRSFGYAAERDLLGNRIARLVSGTDAPSLKADLLTAFRNFMIKNLKGTRCKENTIKPDSVVPAYVRDANFLFAEKPMTIDEIAQTESALGAKVIRYWRSETSKKLQNMFRGLRAAKTQEGMTQDEWSVKFNQFIEELDSWTSSDNETDSEVFNQKAVLLRTLYDSVHERKLREVWMGSFVKFLDRSAMQKQGLIEWLLHARWLANKEPEMFAATAGSSNSPNLRLLVSAKKVEF